MRRPSPFEWAALPAAVALLMTVTIAAPASASPVSAAPAATSWAVAYNLPGVGAADQVFPNGNFTPLAVRTIPMGIDAAFASLTRTFDLQLSAPNGVPLSDGYYPDTHLWSAQGSSVAGMSLLEGGGYCGGAAGAGTGSFAIQDIAFNNGTVTRLRVTFTQLCPNTAIAAFGEFSYNEPASGPLTIQADALLFPHGYVGVPSPQLPLWVTNPGASPVGVGTVTAGGPDPGDVAIVANTCPPKLAPGAMCVITATVSPGAVGVRHSSINVASGSSSQTVAVTDVGLPGNAAFALDGPPDQGYGSLTLTHNQYDSIIEGGGTPNSVVVADGPSAFASIVAPSGQNLAVGVYDNLTSRGGTSASLTIQLLDYATDPTGCDTAIASGQLTVYAIAFDPIGRLTTFAADALYRCPGDISQRSAEFRVASNVPYSALAEQPLPPSLELGDTIVNTTSAPQPATITNTGQIALTPSVTIVGTSAAMFHIVSSTCAAANPIPPGGLCSFTVDFAPTDYGNFVATAVIADNTLIGRHAVTLYGSGDTPPFLTYPYNGQTDVDTTRPFVWTSSPRTSQVAQAYHLIVGTAPGKSDLVDSGILPANQGSYNVPTLPTGKTLYATLYSEIQGQWNGVDSISFVAKDQPVRLLYPTSTGINSSLGQPFTWTTNRSVQGYYLTIGTHPYGTNLINSGVLPPTQYSYQPPPLPANTTLYATLYSETNGGWTTYQSVTFSYQQVGQATFTVPLNGQAIPATSCCQWSAEPTASAYYLVVETSPGKADLVNSGALPASQHCYPANCSLSKALPKGIPLYATLFTKVGGSWVRYQTIVFSAR